MKIDKLKQKPSTTKVGADLKQAATASRVAKIMSDGTDGAKDNGKVRSLPLTSVLPSSADVKEANRLLQEAADSKEMMESYEKIHKEAKDDLSRLCAKSPASAEGLRSGANAMTISNRVRESMDMDKFRDLLIARGIKPDIIGECLEKSKKFTEYVEKRIWRLPGV